MVVHPEHAFPTDRAVMGSWWFQAFALLAVPILDYLFEHIVVWKHLVVVFDRDSYPVSAAPLRSVPLHQRSLWEILILFRA